MEARGRLRRFVSELRAILREEGARAAALRVVDAAGIHRRMLISSGPAMLAPEAPQSYATDLALAFDELDWGSVEDYRRLRPDHDREETRRRLERGDVCVMARHEGRVVGAVWIAPRLAWIEYLACLLPLAEGVVYVYDLHVDPEFRGRRVVHNLGLVQREASVKLGARRFAGTIWDRNRLAIGLHERRGRRAQGEIARLALGPWRRIRIRYAEGVEPVFAVPGRGRRTRWIAARSADGQV